MAHPSPAVSLLYCHSGGIQPQKHVLTYWITRHGTQGNLGAPSQGTLDTEFGTTDEDKVIKKILEQGTAQEMNVCELHTTGNFALFH